MHIKAPVELRKIEEASNGWRILGDQLGLRLTDVAVPDCGPSGLEGRDNQLRALGKDDLHWSTKQVHTHRIVLVSDRVELWEGRFGPHRESSIAEFTVTSLVIKSTGPNDIGLARFLGQIEADGIITDHPNTLAVTVADCMPIGLSLGKWRGLLHSGWQGTGILKLALKILSEPEFEGQQSNLNITLGPSIEAKDYAVPPDRARIFEGRFGPKSVIRCHDGQPGLDLLAANLGLIEESQSAFGDIVVQYCSGSTSKIPFLQSYRRDGASYARSLVIFQNHPLSEVL